MKDREMYPVEACAILFGELAREEVVVRKVVVTPNILHSTERFKIDPETAVKTIAEAEKEGLEFIGLFHSHPAPTTPSTVDLEFMKFGENAIWLILSSVNGSLAAYQMKKGKVTEIEIRVE